MARFCTVDQVTNKILHGLLNDLRVPFRIRSRSGKYLVVNATVDGEKGRQDAVAFGDPARSVVLCFQLCNEGDACLKTQEKEDGPQKLLVFNQAEPPNVLLRERPEQGDFILKLVQRSKLSWFLTNSKETMFVGYTKNENFFVTEQVTKAEELLLELSENLLMERLEARLDSSWIQHKKQLESVLDRVKNSSDKFTSPSAGAFYSIVSAGVRVRFLSHHNSWLKVDWSVDPPILCTTSNQYDPCTEFQMVGLYTIALIFQRDYFMNVTWKRPVCFMKEPCFVGLEWEVSCKRMSMFIPFVDEQLYLCVTRKQNIELHHKKRAWEMFQLFVDEEDMGNVVSSWNGNKASFGMRKQHPMESKKVSNKEGFCYSKAIGNTEALVVNKKEEKHRTDKNGTVSNHHHHENSSSTGLEPKPRKKKNRRRAKQKNRSEAASKTTSHNRVLSNHEGTTSENRNENQAEESSAIDNRRPNNNNNNKEDRTTSHSDSTTTYPQSSSPSVSQVSNTLCAACHQPIVSSYATALGKTFHADCLRCFRCGKTLVTCGDGNFRHESGRPYCNGCYATHIAPRCAKCLQPILDTVTKAMKQNWHPQCLICTQCNTPLSTTFYLFPELPRHPVCSRCAVGIEQNEMRRKQMQNQSHILSTSFRLGTFRPFGGR